MTENNVEETIEGIRRSIYSRVCTTAVVAAARWCGVVFRVGFRSKEASQALGCLVAIPLIVGLLAVGWIGQSILGRDPTGAELLFGAATIGGGLTVLVASAFLASKALETPRTLLIWQYFLQHVVSREGPLPAPTAAVADRLAALFGESGESVIRLGQGAKLLDFHLREQRMMDKVEESIGRTRTVAGELRSRMSELKALGELSASGDAAVAEAEATATTLSDVGVQLGRSLAALDAILRSAEDEHRARRLHREIDALAQESHVGTAPVSAELSVRDATYSLDRRIATELEVYLKLERNARRALDAVHDSR